MMLDQEEKERRLQSKGEKKGSVTISQEDAGYNAIVAMDNLRKQIKAKDGLTDEQLYAMPSTQKFFDFIRAFQKKFPQSATTPEVLYLGANVHFSAKSYQNAISDYKAITDSFPKSEFAKKSLRMLANCYASMGDYEFALKTYDQLIAQEKPESAEYNDIVDLAGGAIFKKASAMKSSGNIAGAADLYKSVYNRFPTSKAAERAWFESGVCYEEANNIESAAKTFEELGTKFTKSDLREKAYIRAAENYKKVERWQDAGNSYVNAALKIQKPDFSPQALYNAGLMFEKAKLYNDGISTYKILAEKYPTSEFAQEAYYSIGFCYEKMADYAQMAKSFKDFAEKYTTNKSKQIEALSKTAKAYFKMNNISAAEATCKTAVDIYEKFNQKADIDVAAVSEAFYTMGEIEQGAFQAVKLTGANAREVESKIRERTKALEGVLKAYANAVSLGVGEWVIRSTYMIGNSFIEMADALRNQTLFGPKEQQIATKIKILSSLEKYYEKAQDKFGWIIETAYNNGISNEWVDKATDDFMEMAYYKGRLLEEVGETFMSAPVPKDLDEKDKEIYKQVLEEKMLEAQDAALPKYEDVVRVAEKFGIVQSQWMDKAKERIQFINPTSDVLNIQIQPRQPKPVIKKEELKTGSISSDEPTQVSVNKSVSEDVQGL
jgi:tetratricopeptide (TPR) repeat protein